MGESSWKKIIMKINGAMLIHSISIQVHNYNLFNECVRVFSYYIARNRYN